MIIKVEDLQQELSRRLNKNGWRWGSISSLIPGIIRILLVNGEGESVQRKCVEALTLEEAMQEAEKFVKSKEDRPEIVCLCGSTKFWREYQKWDLYFTLENKIVLSIGAATGTDDEHFGNLPKAEYDRVKTMLDKLHKRKIDLADYVFVINVGGYIGESTRSEIEYAEKLGKRIEYLESI